MFPDNVERVEWNDCRQYRRGDYVRAEDFDRLLLIYKELQAKLEAWKSAYELTLHEHGLR
jgi:hypothetical protein